MSMKIEVDSWDYSEAVRKINELFASRCPNLQDCPSAVEIVDIVIDTII